MTDSNKHTPREELTPDQAAVSDAFNTAAQRNGFYAPTGDVSLKLVSLYAPSVKSITKGRISNPGDESFCLVVGGGRA